MTVPRSIIHALPKAELHSHIDGSVSGQELFRIAKDNGRKLVTPRGVGLDSVAAFMRYIEGDGYSSLLETVVDRFYPITNMMQTEDALEDVGFAYVRAQKREGVAYTEGRFAPQYHTREGLSLGDAIRSMADGLARGSEEYGVRSSLIVAIGRESPSELGVEVARAAAASRRAVALDLGGPEIGNPPGRFRDAFRIAAESGMKVTVHAGEGAGSRRGNLAYMKAAITELGANRIGHAIDLASDEKMIALVQDRSVAIELNPISNLVLGKIKELEDLSIDRLLRYGIVASLNSDDPALWPRGGLTDVYVEVCKAYGFGLRELDQLAENAFRGAFCSEETRDSLVDEYRKVRRRLS
jgi:adenosine deaminase